MEIISRHSSPTVDPDEYVEMLVEDAEDAIDCLEEQEPDLGAAFDSALAVTRGYSIIDPLAEREESRQSYRTAMQVGSALFAAAAANDSAISAEISGTVRTIAATGPQSDADAANWVTAFWLAVICRDQEAASKLCAVPVSLLRESGAVCDEYLYDWADTLQTYWHGDPHANLGDKLVAAIEGCAPDAVRITPQEHALKIVYPPMNLFYRFILGDEEGFNTALAEALELHKSYYSETEDRAGELQGLVPVELLAISCLAWEAGITIAVDSDYLPRNLLPGIIPAA